MNVILVEAGKNCSASHIMTLIMSRFLVTGGRERNEEPMFIVPYVFLLVDFVKLSVCRGPGGGEPLQVVTRAKLAKLRDMCSPVKYFCEKASKSVKYRQKTAREAL
jgi:hypothetical protein